MGGGMGGGRSMGGGGVSRSGGGMVRSAPSMSRSMSPSAGVNRSAPNTAPRMATRSPVTGQAPSATRLQANKPVPGNSQGLGALNTPRSGNTQHPVNPGNIGNNRNWNGNQNHNRGQYGSNWYGGRQYFFRPGFGWWYWGFNPLLGRYSQYNAPYYNGYGYSYGYGNQYGYNSPSYAYDDATPAYQDNIEPAALGLTFNQTLSGGAYVIEVVPGSPAANAGFQPGDVITAINGGPISNYGEVTGLVQQSRPGDPMQITFLRGGQTRTVEVYLAARAAVFHG